MIFFVRQGKGAGCGCIANLLVLVFFGFLISGAQAVYTALSTGEQLEMSLAEYVKQKPKHKWVKLTDAVLLYEDMVTSRFVGDKIIEVFIPVIAKGEKRDATSRLVLATKQPKYLAIARDVAEAKEDFSKQLLALSKHAEKVVHPLTIEGVVRYGFDDNEKNRQRVFDLQKNLSGDYIILNDGDKPSLMTGLVYIGVSIGFLLLAGAAGLAADKIDSTRPAKPPPLPKI